MKGLMSRNRDKVSDFQIENRFSTMLECVYCARVELFIYVDVMFVRYLCSVINKLFLFTQSLALKKLGLHVNWSQCIKHLLSFKNSCGSSSSKWWKPLLLSLEKSWNKNFYVQLTLGFWANETLIQRFLSERWDNFYKNLIASCVVGDNFVFPPVLWNTASKHQKQHCGVILSSLSSIYCQKYR